MITAAELVNEARKWIGVPFRHQGRSKYGVDCIGFIICARDAAEAWPLGMLEITSYSRNATDATMLDKLNTHCIPTTKAEVGGVILIRWPKMKLPTHVALCVGGNMLHAYRRTGRVIEVGYREPWVRMTTGFYRLPGVNYG